jgi:outer membrane lipoprotein LolB
MAAQGRRILLDGWRATLALLLIAVASGCASLAPIEPATHVYSGRFAASVSRGETREAVSGRFTLAINPARTTLDLAAPLGNTLARVQTSADGAILTAPQADGSLATWKGNSPDALAESVLGFSLPVSGLADWIAGRAVPDRPARLSPDSGRAQRIEQDGWVIVIEDRFEETGAPRRLTFDRRADASTGPSMQLRLVLDVPGTTITEPDRFRQ